jgi:hypothetical protein
VATITAPGKEARWLSAYILIQTEVGKAAQVAVEVDGIDGVVSAETSPGLRRDRPGRGLHGGQLRKMVVSRVQMIDGITRTLTCPSSTFEVGTASRRDRRDDDGGRQPHEEEAARPVSR